MTLFNLALVLVMLYAAIVVLACVGWLIQPPAHQNSSRANTFNVSVIVPFRNEEKNLPALLHSLHTQNQPLEVVLVNDHSTDDSEAGIKQFLHQHPETQLSVKVVPSQGQGKKQASVTGLQAATHTQIVFTDADCVFPSDYFNRLNAEWIRDADFFYGPVINSKGKSFLSDIFFLDQLALNTVALGLGGVGIHTYCSGANMGGKKEKLLEATGELLHTSNLSGDDVTYLQQAVRQKQKIKVLTEPVLTVITQSPPGFAAFWVQRLRWGQKAPAYRSVALLALSAFVGLVSFTVLAVLIACFSGKTQELWWGIPLVKLCIDLLFLFLVALRLRVSRYLWAFLPAWLLNLLYIPLVAVLGLVVNPTWKGRKVKTTTPR